VRSPKLRTSTTTLITDSQITAGRVTLPVTTTPIVAITGRTSVDAVSKKAAKAIPAVAVSAGMSHWR
jgi:hypothetical protein